MAEAVDSIRKNLNLSNLGAIGHISIFLYFNKDGNQPLVVQEMEVLNDFLNELPENIDAIWAIYPDESIKDHEIKDTIIVAGKELDNG